MDGGQPAHLTMRLGQNRPTSTALDTVQNEQRHAPRSQVLPIGRARRAPGHGARLDTDARHRAHGLNGVHTTGREAHTQVFGDQADGTVSGAQYRVLRPGGGPHGGRLIGTRQHAGNRAARTEGFEMPAQLVVGQHAREIHHRIFAGELPVAQCAQRLIGGMPFGGRVDHEQRAVLLAIARRDQQQAYADILLTRQWRNAQQIEILHAVEREQARVIHPRTDHIVIGQGRAVVAVGVRNQIAGGQPADRVQGLIRPLVGRGSGQSHQRRPLEHGAHVPLGFTPHG